ncbi:MAG: class I tRNA ligase family protein [Patescibacteria group bacterium]|nr:class I tRNA ligase family protein [Patescibacteria group bacterium]
MGTIRRKFYITTSIAYTNDFPHLGFVLESVQADVIARYHRILGDDVFFLTGVDEHGMKIVKKAKEADKEPKEFVDEISSKYKELKKVFNLSNDDFIRTTDKKKHWPGVKKVWLKLKENNDIYKKKYKGLYCVGCEAFILEKDLINGKCPVHNKKPEIIEEENYFFKFSKYSKKLKNLIEKDKIKIIPDTRKNETLSLINQGLLDISFSRTKERLGWGIEVPEDSTQTIYVWADALVNYISALGYDKDSQKFKKYWPADMHCVGKDILRFHSLIWPAMLLSLGLKLPKKILVHGFINVNHKKMSKSLGNVIDPFKLYKRYGADSVRYYLLREILPTEDGDFTYEKFESRYNSDLASGLGNLVARVITMAKKCQSANVAQIKVQVLMDKEIKTTWKNYKEALDNFKFNEALAEIWKLISFCDKYIEEQRPWEDTENKSLIISDLLITLTNISEMIKPFLPETSERIIKQIKDKKSKVLFPRI